MPDLMLRGGDVYHVRSDQRVSVRAVVRVSDGQVAQRVDYDAWGVITTDTAPTFHSLGYAGGLTDRATALVRFGARDYEPGTGRWTAKDSGPEPDDTNLFAYSFSDPIGDLDPSGASAIPRARNKAQHYSAVAQSAKKLANLLVDCELCRQRAPDLGTNDAEDNAIRHAGAACDISRRHGVIVGVAAGIGYEGMTFERSILHPEDTLTDILNDIIGAVSREDARRLLNSGKLYKDGFLIPQAILPPSQKGRR